MSSKILNIFLFFWFFERFSFKRCLAAQTHLPNIKLCPWAPLYGWFGPCPTHATHLSHHHSYANIAELCHAKHSPFLISHTKLAYYRIRWPSPIDLLIAQQLDHNLAHARLPCPRPSNPIGVLSTCMACSLYQVLAMKQTLCKATILFPLS